MARDKIRIEDIGSYGFRRWVVQYVPFTGRIKTLSLFGQKEFEMRKNAQKAIKRAGGANKLKRKYRPRK